MMGHKGMQVSMKALTRATALPIVALGVLLLGGCAGDQPGDPAAMGPGGTAGAAGGRAAPRTAAQFSGAPAPPTTAAEYLAEPPYAGADLARGEILSFACRACHGFAPGDPSPLGPTLDGVIGRQAASIDGFGYSAAMRAVDLVWTPAAIDAWLAAPNDFLPGTSMAFTGYRSATDRRDLIAYLIRETSAASREDAVGSR